MSGPDDFQLARYGLISQLKRDGITSPRVLEAIARVPRERFMGPEVRHLAYADRALPIACDQTISQPYIVALMTQALELTGHEKVLEIGTGSGYQTVILAELAAAVFSIERWAELAGSAAETLAELGYHNVTLRVGDGTAGWPDAAPFDRIIVTAAAPDCPPALFEQLGEGGILVIPVGTSGGQVLRSIRKVNARPVQTDLCGCRFVPLISDQPANQ